jgi:hypothetical protein
MPDTTRQSPAGDSFAELVCADPDWVRAEFAAIVAANFPATADVPTPPRRRPREPTGPHRPAAPRATAVRVPCVLTAHTPVRAVEPSGRQRSPPHAPHPCTLSSCFVL